MRASTRFGIMAGNRTRNGRSAHMQKKQISVNKKPTSIRPFFWTTIAVLSLILLNSGCISLLGLEKEPEFTNSLELDKGTFQKYVIDKQKTALVKFYYPPYQTWQSFDQELDLVAGHYGGAVLAGKLNWRNNPELGAAYVKTAYESYVIFHGGRVVRTFDVAQPFWVFREIIDSLLSIPRPDTTPELEITWTRLAESLPFQMVSRARVVVFDSKIRVLYGTDALIHSTSDGVSWTSCGPTATPSPGCALFVDTNCIWGVGGLFTYAFPTGAQSFRLSFVGDSAVGSIFAPAVYELQSSFDVQLIRFGDSLMTVGGWSEEELQYANDWHIKIGETNWINTGCSHETGHAIFYFKGSFWLTGGESSFELQDYALQFDGGYWSNQSDVYAYGFTKRKNHAAVAMGDVAIVLAGSGGTESTKDLSDAFFTKDCIDWYRVKQVTPFSPRSAPQCVYFNGKLWLFGGSAGGTTLNDLWVGQITMKKL